MGVRRGAWEEIRRGEVWRPGMVQTHVPALSMADALRWRAKAAASDPKAGWMALAGDALKGIANIGVKVMGVYDQQRQAYKDAMAALREEEKAVKQGKQYDPAKMQRLINETNRAETTMKSWKTKFGMNEVIHELSAEEAAHSFLAGQDIPDDVAAKVNKAIGLSVPKPAEAAPAQPQKTKYNFTIGEKDIDPETDEASYKRREQ